MMKSSSKFTFKSKSTVAYDDFDFPQLSRLYRVREEIGLREIDFQFARFIQQQEQAINADLSSSQYSSLSLSKSQSSNNPLDDLGVLACVLSYEVSKGNVCLDLNQSHPFLLDYQKTRQKMDLGAFQTIAIIEDEYNARINDLEIRRPLIFEKNRLYLQRYWFYESSLSQQIQARLKPMVWAGKPETIKLVQTELSRLFDLPSNKNKPDKNESGKKIDWQAISACVASQKQFSVISGGPGTGKTTTVIRLLAIIVGLYLQQTNRVPIIKLAAPTGKAAMRLSESIKGAKQKLNAEPALKQAIPEEASTLHRLLKQGRLGEFKHNQSDPLHLDVLVVDEASMVDLPLMSKLMDALPAEAQIILLGDKDQLASVEAGSVLGDICDSGQQHGYSSALIAQINQLSNSGLSDEYKSRRGAAIQDHLCQLKTSYRFHENSGIGHLARAANEGDYTAWQAVINKGYSDLQIWPSDIDQSQGLLVKQAVDGYSDYLTVSEKFNDHNEKSALAVHEAFNDFQVLCALRQGEAGVSGLNHQIEQALIAASLIQHPPQSELNTETDQPIWYAGRPIMVMENDYALKLFNGDIGIALEVISDTGQKSLKVSFVTADGQVRWIKPSRLPKHETVFAMTIHKSQGSEFKHCVMVLPPVMVSVLNKELIYTGITRAKTRFTLLAEPNIVRRALQKRVQRASGLRNRLWQQDNDEEDKTLASSDSNEDNSNSGEQFSLF